MEGSRAVDAYARIDDHESETGDAEQAYVQTLLKGDETWVMLPEKFWKPEWYRLGMRRSVIRLVKALYGSSQCRCLLGRALPRNSHEKSRMGAGQESILIVLAPYT